VDGHKPTPAELTILIAGGVMLIASFLHFQGSSSAWDRSYPVVALLPLYGVIMAAEIAITDLAGVKLPGRVAGFTWEQVHLVLGIMAALMAVAWILTDTGKKPIGQWLEIAGGIALAVGAIRIQRERRTGAIG
jgi:hypothetical protein